MDWLQILSNTASVDPQPRDDRLRAGRPRPRGALRLRRPAQHGHRRLHGRRRLRLRDLDAHLRPRRGGSPPSSACVASARLRPDPRHPDAAAARRLPRDRDDRRRGGRAPALPDERVRRRHRLGRRPERLSRQLPRREPDPRRAPTASVRGRTTRPGWWVRIIGPRHARLRRARWSGCSCAARGAACSRASARTRTPCARSARTSTPTRCRPSSSAACSPPPAASSTPCRPRSAPAST